MQVVRNCYGVYLVLDDRRLAGQLVPVCCEAQGLMGGCGLKEEKKHQPEHSIYYENEGAIAQRIPVLLLSEVYFNFLLPLLSIIEFVFLY